MIKLLLIGYIVVEALINKHNIQQMLPLQEYIASCQEEHNTYKKHGMDIEIYCTQKSPKTTKTIGYKTPISQIQQTTTTIENMTPQQCQTICNRLRPTKTEEQK